MTPQEFRANELAMKAFGLLPADYNLREALAQVYSEEVAAFYDPKTKTMHLIEEPKKPAKKKPGLLERLFGKTSEFDKDENKTVIAHELTHALADQHYDLDALQKNVKKDDDRSLALSALIEGEATLAMFGAGMDDWNGDEIVALPAENLEWTFNLISPFMAFMGGGQVDPECTADHQRVDDLPLFPRDGLLREADQHRRMGGHRPGLPRPAAFNRADPPSREVSRAARLSDVDRSRYAGSGRGLEGSWAKRARRNAARHPSEKARRKECRSRLGRRPIRRFRGPEGKARAGLGLDLGQRGRRP